MTEEAEHFFKYDGEDLYGDPCHVCRICGYAPSPGFGGRRKVKGCSSDPILRRHAVEEVELEERHKAELQALYKRQAEEIKEAEAIRVLEAKGYKVEK